MPWPESYRRGNSEHRKILRMKANGYSLKYISDAMGMTRQQVTEVTNNKEFKKELAVMMDKIDAEFVKRAAGIGLIEALQRIRKK